MTEIMLDANEGKTYPSRNYNDLRHTWSDDRQTERCDVDWLLTLRQVIPKKKKSPYPPSVPTIHSPRERPSNTTEPEQGPFMSRWSGSGRGERSKSTAKASHTHNPLSFPQVAMKHTYFAEPERVPQKATPAASPPLWYTGNVFTDPTRGVHQLVLWPVTPVAL